MEFPPDPIFLVGVLGALVLVTGAAWPKKMGSAAMSLSPLKSVKNWLFAVGGILMLLFAALGYIYQEGSVFFVFLEALVLVASILMMIDVDDRINLAVIGTAGVGFVVWSLFLFEGFSTVFFIVGLSGIALGYAFKMGTVRRDLALTLGSILIATFSYLEMNWVFFWLNVFFAIFSAWYLVKGLRGRQTGV